MRCRQEQVFEREQIFGRDAASVFPTQNKKAAAEAAEALKSKLGANRFISESEVSHRMLYMRIAAVRGVTALTGDDCPSNLGQVVCELEFTAVTRFKSYRKRMEATLRVQSQSNLWLTFCWKPSRPRMRHFKISGNR